MKTRCIFLFALVCLAAKAQITEINLNIQHRSIVYADKKFVYAYDSEAFYRYEDISDSSSYTGPYYVCDTIKWEMPAVAPVRYYQYESPMFCKFSDPLNGIILRRLLTASPKCITLKTTDGGKHWSLLHELPDSVGLDAELAFHDFDNYLINQTPMHCLYKNGKFTKFQLDTLHDTFSAHYGDGFFAMASMYSKGAYISTDNGSSWEKCDVPSDSSFFNYRMLSSAKIQNGKLYLFHKTSPYADYSLKYSYLTVIDPHTKQTVQTTQKNHFTHMLIDRKGEPYFTKDTYYTDVNGSTYSYRLDWTLQLMANDTSVVTSRLPNLRDQIQYFQGLDWNLIQINDSTLYYFDHPDCNNIDMLEARLENNWVEINVGLKAEIEPIHYPYLMVIDSQDGDTVSNLCCHYLLDHYYINQQKDSFDGKVFKQPSSDSILVLLSQLPRSSALCVAKTTFEIIQDPLSLETGASREMAFHVFPNPSSDFFQIANATQAFDMKLVNDIGQVIIQKSRLAPQERIDVRHLNRGHYSIIVTFDKGTAHRFSFLKW